MKKFNAGVSLRNSFKVVDTCREEKQATRRGSRKAWYKRSDSDKDDMTTGRPHVMRMVFFKTSEYKVNPGNDSMNCRPQLVRTFTEEDVDEFDETPKSEEVPVAFLEAMGEKRKPEEDSAVTTFFEVMDEKLKPLDDPVYYREQLPGPPSSRYEDDDEFEETSNHEVYPVCYWEHLPSLPSLCHEDDYEFEEKSKPEEDVVSSSRLEDDNEIEENSNTEMYSMSYWKQQSSLPSVCYEDDNEFEEKSKPEGNLMYHNTGGASRPEVTLTHTKKEKMLMLNKLTKVLFCKKSINEKLFFETDADKPLYAEEPLPDTSLQGEDDFEVTETTKPTFTPINETEMLMMAKVTKTEAPTVALKGQNKIIKCQHERKKLPLISLSCYDESISLSGYGRKKLPRTLLDCDDDSVTA